MDNFGQQPGMGQPYGGQPNDLPTKLTGQPNQSQGLPAMNPSYNRQPGMNQPGMGQPYGQPGMNQPYGQQPGMNQPYGQQPGMNQPYGQPGMNQNQPRQYNQGPIMNGQPPKKSGGKTLAIILAIVGVLVVGAIVAVVAVVLNMVNKEKVEATAGSFMSACTEAGLTSYKEEDASKNPENAITSAYAYNEDWEVFMELEQFPTEDGARTFYTKYAFDSGEGSGSYSTVNGKNYEYIKGNYGGKFYYTIRVNNTVIVAYSSDANKDKVMDVMEKLGY